jgi:hypothetical protein
MPAYRKAIALPLRVALAGLSALVLASCDAGGVRTVTYGTYSPTATYYFAAWAGSRGPLLIELRNSPYPDPPERVAEIIAGSATGSYMLPGVTFTAQPALAWQPDWRIVYAFQVPEGMRMEQVCDPASPLPSASRSGEWYALAVFCNGPRPIRGTASWSKPVPGPDSPEFRRWASYTMYGMFPSGYEGSANPNPPPIPP